MAGRPSTLVIRVTGDTAPARAAIERVGRSLERFEKAGTAAARSVAKLSAAMAGGLGFAPIAAAAASAGAALGAFAVAAGPQMQKVADATELYAKAQEEALTDTKKSAETMKEYQAQLKAMPRATRDSTKAMVSLKDAYSDWSDSLSDNTMPLFTKALKGLKAALPALTPLVQAAARAMEPFIDRFKEAAENGDLERFTSKLSRFAGPALRDTIQVIENLAVGFANLFMVFAGRTATSASDGLVDLTQRFREWSETAGQSEGMRTLSDVASRMWETFLRLVPAVLALLEALTPVVEVFSEITLAVAGFLEKVPPDVLKAVAIGFIGVSVAVKTLRLAYIALNTTFLTSPLGWVALAITAIGAALIYAYNHSATFRNIVSRAMDAVRYAVDLLKDAYQRNKKEFDQFFEAAKQLAVLFGKSLVYAIIGTAKVLAFLIDAVSDASRWVQGLDRALDNLATTLSRPFHLAFSVSGLGDLFRTGLLSAGGLSSAVTATAPAGLGARALPSLNGLRTVVGASPIAVFITIDGEQLQGRITRTMRAGLNADGNLLRAGRALYS